MGCAKFSASDRRRMPLSRPRPDWIVLGASRIVQCDLHHPRRFHPVHQFIKLFEALGITEVRQNSAIHSPQPLNLYTKVTAKANRLAEPARSASRDGTRNFRVPALKFVRLRANSAKLAPALNHFSKAPMQPGLGGSSYWTSRGSVPVGWPLASVVILSTRASAWRSNSSHRRFKASPRS
jgi:hypothetical protein